MITKDFAGGSVVKKQNKTKQNKTPANARDMGLIPRLERSPGEGNGSPYQHSCLGNPMDSGAWWVIVHGATKESDMT